MTLNLVSLLHFQAELSFDLTSPPMNSGYHNPTAQSTPVTGVRRNGVGGLSSMLTTPNNSVLSLIQEAEANSAGLGDINTPKSSHSQRNSPVRNQAKLSDAPRTPTPFKRALADVYQRGEPLSNTVSEITYE